MQWERREFLRASAFAMVGGALRGAPAFAQQGAQAPATPVFTPLRRNIGTFTARGGTIGWLVAPDGVVVVDSQFPDTAQMFLDGLKPRTQRRIDVLVNTHHHGDHTAGNKTMKPAVAKIVGHANQPALQRQRAVAAKNEADQVYADDTFKESWRADLGNEIILGKHYGPGHTGGDITVFFERANVVHMGDLMFHLRHPVIDRPGGASIRNWIVTLGKVAGEHGADTIYIFGHSKVGAPVTGTRAELKALGDYLSALLDYTQKQIAAGRSVDKIAKAPQLPGFEQYEGTPERPLRMAYEELTAKA
jgi:glyoxylase-like metal-dependent hydrolase (beta-lactamase superfamily II)